MNAKGGITEEQKVTRILGSFRDSLIRDWIWSERSALTALTFPEFMKEFRRRWLHKDWEYMVRIKVLGAHLETNSSLGLHTSDS